MPYQNLIASYNNDHDSTLNRFLLQRLVGLGTLVNDVIFV